MNLEIKTITLLNSTVYDVVDENDKVFFQTSDFGEAEEFVKGYKGEENKSFQFKNEWGSGWTLPASQQIQPRNQVDRNDKPRMVWDIEGDQVEAERKFDGRISFEQELKKNGGFQITEDFKKSNLFEYRDEKLKKFKERFEAWEKNSEQVLVLFRGCYSKFFFEMMEHGSFRLQNNIASLRQTIERGFEIVKKHPDFDHYYDDFYFLNFRHCGFEKEIELIFQSSSGPQIENIKWLISYPINFGGFMKQPKIEPGDLVGVDKDGNIVKVKSDLYPDLYPELREKNIELNNTITRIYNHNNFQPSLEVQKGIQKATDELKKEGFENLKKFQDVKEIRELWGIKENSNTLQSSETEKEKFENLNVDLFECWEMQDSTTFTKGPIECFVNIKNRFETLKNDLKFHEDWKPYSLSEIIVRPNGLCLKFEKFNNEGIYEFQHISFNSRIDWTVFQREPFSGLVLPLKSN